MALDSNKKRANAARVGRPWIRSKWPGADLSTQTGRVASSNTYGGNTVASTASEVISNLTHSTLEQIRYKMGTAI